MKWGSLFVALGFPVFFASTTIQTNVCQVPTQPALTEPADGTVVTDATIMIAGTTTETSTVNITDNSIQVASVMSDASGAFQVQVLLSPGQNQLGAQTTNPCGTSSVASVAVTYNAPPTPSGGGSGSSSGETGGLPISSGGHPITVQPIISPQSSSTSTSDFEVTITSPANNAEIKDDSVLLLGTTNLPATETVTVNGINVANIYSSSLSFGISVPLLNSGENTIKVVARHGDQTASDEITVNHVLSSGSATQQGNHVPWYKTTPGKIAIVTGTVIVIGGAGAALIRWRRP